MNAVAVLDDAGDIISGHLHVEISDDKNFYQRAINIHRDN